MRRKIQRARLGLVNRSARDTTSRASQCINAKAETLEQRPTSREPYRDFARDLPCGLILKQRGESAGAKTAKRSRRPGWPLRRSQKIFLSVTQDEGFVEILEIRVQRV
jgi:hypothetical protein